MRLSRSDVLPILAIAFGGTVGSALMLTALYEVWDDGPHVVHHEVVYVMETADEADESVQPTTYWHFKGPDGSSMKTTEPVWVAYGSEDELRQVTEPRWSPDGERLVFTDGDGGAWIYRRSDGGDGGPQLFWIRGPQGLQVRRSTPPNPLIYVDGVRLDGDASVENIEPNTIDRIEVVKGEAAMELYGPEAAGGVIQIYLKEAEPQVGSKIRIRGDESLRIESERAIRFHASSGELIEPNPEPLIYVDGVRLADREAFDEIDPETIDRIEVIKGPPALEQYGEEGLNGVILIFLKK